MKNQDKIKKLQKLIDSPDVSVLIKSKAKEKIKALEYSQDKPFYKASEYFYKKYKVNLPKKGNNIKFRDKSYEVFSVDKNGVNLGYTGEVKPALAVAIYPFIKEYFQGYKKELDGNKVYYVGNGEKLTIDELAEKEDLTEPVRKNYGIKRGQGLKALLKDEPKENNMKDTDELLANLKKKKATKKKANKKPIGKPKSFIYVKTEGNPSKTRSGRKLTFKVYEIQDNIPGYIGHAEANSASYKGDTSTVLNFLAKEGKVSEDLSNSYYKSDMEDKFVIREV